MTITVERRLVSAEHTVKKSVPRQIGEMLKGAVRDIGPAQYQKMMSKQYQKLMLMDNEGKWKSDELKAVSDNILPADITSGKVNALIDEMAASVEANPYLMDFLNRAKAEKFERLAKKVKNEGSEVFPEVVAYSILLDRLTKAQIDDHRLLESCMKVFAIARAEEGLNFVSAGIIATIKSLFGYAKLATIEDPIKKFLDAHKTGKVDPKLFKCLLPINIFEAMLLDIYSNNFDNAKSAWPLLLNRPGGNYNARLGTGAATFSKDMRTVLLKMPLPKKWTDLYLTWNLAFVSRFRYFPFLMPKLLIPQVGSYHDVPEEFIYRRVLALYTQIHFYFLGNILDQKEGRQPIDWKDKDLTRLWGKVNKKSAEKYNKTIKKIKKSERIENL